MNYLFEEQNQGYWSTYIPFTCNKKLTQELVYKFFDKHGTARRTGGNLKMLVDPAGEEGFIIEPFYSTYKRMPIFDNTFMSPEQFARYSDTIKNLTLDWLPKDFEEWEVLCGIAGNY
jgi:hypothetical protein